MDTRTTPALPSGLEFVKLGVEGYEYSMYLEIWLVLEGTRDGAVFKTEPTFKSIPVDDQERIDTSKYCLVSISTTARKGRQEILVVTPATLHLLEK